MATIVKNVTVSWNWVGDDSSIIGYDLTLTTGQNPNTEAVIASQMVSVGPAAKSFTLQDGIWTVGETYTIWVRAKYVGKDSEWIACTPFLIADDAAANINNNDIVDTNLSNVWVTLPESGADVTRDNTANDTYHVNGTLSSDLTDAVDTANNAVAAIADDSIFTAGEKQSNLPNWHAILEQKPTLITQAKDLGVSYTAYNDVYTTLYNYMNPMMADVETDTSITRSTFTTNWSNYFDEWQKLSNAIAAKAATVATASGVSGSGDLITKDRNDLNFEDGADKTSLHTANDTKLVNGVAAATVTSNAAAGATFTSTDAGALAYKAAIDSATLINNSVISSAKLDTTVIDGGYIKSSLLTASNIETGTLDADKVTINNLSVSQIVAGDASRTLVSIVEDEEAGTGLYSGTMKVSRGGTVVVEVGYQQESSGFSDRAFTVYGLQGDYAAEITNGSATDALKCTGGVDIASGGLSVNGPGEVIRATNNESSFSVLPSQDAAVVGATSNGDPGVYGYGDNVGAGVYGHSNSTYSNDPGVYGFNPNSVGVYGVGGSGAGDWCVLGAAGTLPSDITSTTGGVVGYHTGSSSFGVAGISNHCGVYADGNDYCFYAGGSGSNYLPFTGSHDGILPLTETPDPGDILVDTAVLNKSSVSSALCSQVVSSQAKMKNVVGVFVRSLPVVAENTVLQPGDTDADGNPVQEQTIIQGTLDELVTEFNDCTTFDEFLAICRRANLPAGINERIVDTPNDSTFSQYRDLLVTILQTHSRIVMNSIGEGLINVCSEGGNIETGDYICSSNTLGKGMKQDDDLLHNYTVAKSREDVVWTQEEIDNNTVKLIACTYHCG